MTDSSGTLWLGEQLDATGARTGAPVAIEPGHLTTHGVIVGMTGSGKTGLGIVLIEEALLRGIPVLVIDPKGDMGNLLLNFPSLRAEDFLPWVDTGEAVRTGGDPASVAADAADSWRRGLESWGVSSERMRRLGVGADFTIYSPGSQSGVPLNVLGSLTAPADGDAEARVDEIAGFVSGLLTLVGRTADPVSGRDHILLSALIDRAWQAGTTLDLATLVAQVATPPVRKLGVFELDTFIPPDERMALAVQLNALLASPAFAAWMQGPPLDIERMLRTAGDKPRAAIVYLAHLSDAERQFVVTLLLSKLVTWMRRQPGTADLRALIYMDEVFGFAPPTAEPPSKKPILTILKQARAHGVGMVLSTQNPVDLDYKAMSNAGTWMIGRLQTERDKARILEGMRAAAGDTDLAELDRLLGGLGKRQFILHTSRGGAPVRFTTRWAMSYLRGPLTRTELERLMEDHPERAASGAAPAQGSATAPGASAPQTAHAHDETPVAPRTPARVPVRYLDPAAPWAAELGAVAGGRRLEPALAARVRLKFDDTTAGVDHDETYECVLFPLGAHPRMADAQAVDYDERDFRTDAPDGAAYVIPAADLSAASLYREAERDLKDHLYASRKVEIQHNPELKLYARVGEDAASFLERCSAAAAAEADTEAARLRTRYEDKLRRAQQRQRDAERRADEAEVNAQQRKQHEIVAGAGALLSMFLGGRRSVRGLSGVASRRSTSVRARERLTTAQQKADDLEREIEVLEDELAAELEAITERWDTAATRTETRTIPLDKSDIAVEEVVLLWVPTG